MSEQAPQFTTQAQVNMRMSRVYDRLDFEEDQEVRRDLENQLEELKKKKQSFRPIEKRQLVPQKIARKSAPVTTGVHKPYLSSSGRIYEKFRECLQYIESTIKEDLDSVPMGYMRTKSENILQYCQKVLTDKEMRITVMEQEFVAQEAFEKKEEEIVKMKRRHKVAQLISSKAYEQ